jgi:hypothetical protein
LTQNRINKVAIISNPLAARRFCPEEVFVVWEGKLVVVGGVVGPAVVGWLDDVALVADVVALVVCPVVLFPVVVPFVV